MFSSESSLGPSQKGVWVWPRPRISRGADSGGESWTRLSGESYAGAPFNGLAIAGGSLTADLILADPDLKRRARDLMLRFSEQLLMGLPSKTFRSTVRTDRAHGPVQTIQPD